MTLSVAPPARGQAAPKPAASAPAMSADEQLAAAEKAFADLDYDVAVALVRPLARSPELDVEQRKRALFLLGAGLAIIADPVDAEEPFRELLQLDPSYDIADTTAPRVLAAFRRVQTSEVARRRHEREIARAALVARMGIEGARPLTAQGGQPLAFAFKVIDPDDVVRTVRLYYRRQGAQHYAMLPLTARDGAYSGELAAEITASPVRYRLEWYVTTEDDAGEVLVTLHDADAPLATMVEAGDVQRGRPFYRTWWFWTAAVATVAAGVTTGVLASERAHAAPSTDLGSVPIR